jgi:hypothetical protein
MNRVETILFHATTIVLTLTGLVYAAMHTLVKPVDPFSVVGSPWEPVVLKAHILVAPALVLLVGLIAHSHILLKLQSGAQSGRRTGVLLIALFLIMTFSGYALQTVTDARKTVMVVHLTSGSLWFLMYLFHQVSAIRVKRRMADQAAERQRMQNGSAF